jgi:hypothetical protein
MAHIGYTRSGCHFLSQGKEMWNVKILRLETFNNTKIARQCILVG